MIVVKIELHSAVTGKITEIGKTVIFNDGTGTTTRGNYKCLVGRKGDNLTKIHRSPARVSEVKNYPRLSYSVWRLVIRALLGAFPEEQQ